MPRAHGTFDIAAKHPHAAQVCRLMVSTPVVHVIDDDIYSFAHGTTLSMKQSSDNIVK